MKFTIDGREYEVWELSNEQVLKLLESDGDTTKYPTLHLDSFQRAELEKIVMNRFKDNLCPRTNECETEENVFARFFGNFVNGRCHDKKKVAKVMCREHRYLQNEMFKVCLEYIKALAENCEKGCYDGRNKYAAETSKKIIDFFKEVDWPY